MTTGGTVSEFTNRLYNVMDRIEYRRIESLEDMEEVSRLRRKAYSKANYLVPEEGHLFIDDMDFDPQAYVFGIYCDEQLISTIRIHHVTPSHRVCSSRVVYQREVDEFLDAGMSLIDPVRHASDPDLFDDLPALPYLTLRIATMASDYFSADRCLSLVPIKHVAFYRRVFQSHQIADPIPNCKGYDVDATLLAANIPVSLPKVYERYPFFKSHPYERRMMFAPSQELGTMPLTILPTARYLAAA